MDGWIVSHDENRGNELTARGLRENGRNDMTLDGWTDSATSTGTLDGTSTSVSVSTISSFDSSISSSSSGGGGGGGGGGGYLIRGRTSYAGSDYAEPNFSSVEDLERETMILGKMTKTSATTALPLHTYNGAIGTLEILRLQDIDCFIRRTVISVDVRSGSYYTFFIGFRDPYFIAHLQRTSRS